MRKLLGGRMRRVASIGLFLAIVLGAVAAWAGPPFETDDPEPIDYKNYEFYTFASADGTPVEMDTAGPAVEFNWGALPNVHLHIILPLVAILPRAQPGMGPADPSQFGFGDIEAGVKYRFIQESKHRPQVGTFVMFELPSGNANRGLGIGKTWYKVPLWAQKSFGPWTTYGGGGETIFNRVEGYRNFPFAGWLVERDLNKKLTLGSEIFYHGPEGDATPQFRASALLNVGGYYKFRDPGFQLLFAYGHTVAGQSENYAYLGLYWTWGKQGEKTDKDSASARAGTAGGGGQTLGWGRLQQGSAGWQ